jgi:FkbM family methyltransferase
MHYILMLSYQGLIFMNCENVLRPFGNAVNFLLGQDNYEKFAMAWFHFKMKTNFTNDNIKYLKNIIHDGDLCFDIGANRGEVTYYISLLAGNNGRVISVEPVSKARALLENTVEKFNLTNVEVFPIALSNEAGVFEMFVPKVNGVHIFALAELEKNDNKPTKEGYHEKVKVDTLDNIVKRISPAKLSFIKCDVEGHELEVFQGGKETINKYKPVVFAEIWECKQRVKNGKITSDLIEFFEAHGYKTRIIYNKTIREADADIIKNNKIQDFFFFPPA